MSDFIFKVPELPEDILPKRRRIDVTEEKCSANNGVEFFTETGNTSQMGLINKCKTCDCFRLRSLQENNDENLAKPSTSKLVNGSTMNIYQITFPNMENQNAYNMRIDTRSNCFLDSERRGYDSNYSFDNINSHDRSHSMFTNKLIRCCPNSGSISVNNPNSVINQNFKNSCAKFNNLNRKNQFDDYDHTNYSRIKNIEPYSTVNAQKSVFSSDLLPEKGSYKNISMNKSMNKVSAKFSTYEALNGTDVTQKDSMCPLNLSQSVLQNQTIMKSVLQASVFSMKEQIMNIMENFGQKLLRDAPEMEESFFKVTKDLKSIFENSSTFMNQGMGTTEMLSTLNCISDGTEFRLKNMLQCQYQSHEPSKKPCNILKEIQSGQNEIPKVEFIKTFTIEEKKKRDPHNDEFDEKLDFNSPSPKAIKSKEINLRNWYPIVLKEGLAFSGLNDNNFVFKTETMKKRINNRKVLLNDGCICNLIGKGNPEKKFPPDISKKLRNGIDAKWKILKDKISKFQKESEENMKIDDTKNKKTSANVKTSCVTSKKDETFENKNTKAGNKDKHSSRIIYVTRSGRAVKRPRDVLSGENFNSKNMKNKSEQSKNENVQTTRTVSNSRERVKKTGNNSEPKSLNSTLNRKGKNSESKGYKKNTRSSSQKSENIDSWINDFDDGLINISELPNEELKADIKKMKFLISGTPPLKTLRSHLKILRSSTPVAQSPCWLLSQHTESAVKKFEKVRAQIFNKKIPKEKVTKSKKKTKVSAQNKDVEAVLNWISEREVKSPKKCSKVMKYVIPKRSELEDEDDMED